MAGCDASAAGSNAYDEGRFGDAHDAFVAVTLGDDAAPELLYDRALAALRAGRLDDAVATLAREREAPAGDTRPLLVFLEGNVQFARAERAAQQARAPEAEPFAWDLAIRQALSARDAFRQAAATREDWPQARRNAERAARLLEKLRGEKAAADPNARSASSPEVRLHAGKGTQDPDATDAPDPPASGAGDDGAATQTTLA
jgi:hypothetical protein